MSFPNRFDFIPIGDYTGGRMASRRSLQSEVSAFLPLTPPWFHILLTLSEQPTHGYAIRQAVDARTDGRLRLWPATLYGTIGELEDAGLIEEWAPADTQDALPRRFYKLTRSAFACSRRNGTARGVGAAGARRCGPETPHVTPGAPAPDP